MHVDSIFEHLRVQRWLGSIVLCQRESDKLWTSLISSSSGELAAHQWIRRDRGGRGYHHSVRLVRRWTDLRVSSLWLLWVHMQYTLSGLSLLVVVCKDPRMGLRQWATAVMGTVAAAANSSICRTKPPSRTRHTGATCSTSRFLIITASLKTVGHCHLPSLWSVMW